MSYPADGLTNGEESQTLVFTTFSMRLEGSKKKAKGRGMFNISSRMLAILGFMFEYMAYTRGADVVLSPSALFHKLSPEKPDAVNCIGGFVLPLGLFPPRLVPRKEQSARIEDRQSAVLQMFELQLPLVKNLDDHLELPYSTVSINI